MVGCGCRARGGDVTGRPGCGDTPYGGRRLLVRPCPSPEENLQGFVQRAADANGFPAGSLWKHVVQGLGGPPGAGISFLTGLTGCTPAEAKSLLKPPRPRVPWALLPGVGVSEAAATAQARICPACVAINGIVRACWCLRLYVGCDEHRVRLLSRCGRCGCGLARFRPSVSHCACGADLLAQGTERISDDEAALLASIRAACKGSRTVVEDPKNPDELSLDDLLNLVTLVGAREASPSGARPIARDEETAGAIVSNSAPILKDWPRSFVRFLQPILLGYPEDCEPRAGYGERRMLKVLNRPSDKKLSGPARDMMLKLALSAIEGKGIARLNPKSVDLGNGAAVGYMSTAEAGRIAGTTFNSIQRKLRRSGMRELRGPHLRNPGVMYSRSETEAFAAQVRRDAAARAPLVSMRSLVGILGIAPSSATSAVAAGLVGREMIGAREMYRAADAQRLLCDLQRTASGNDAERGDLRPRLVLATFPRLSMGELLQGILSGRVRAAWSPTSSGPRRGTRPWIGVNNCVVRVDDVRELDGELSGYLTPNKAAALLDIGVKNLFVLIGIGCLEGVGFAVSGGQSKVAIPKASIDEFRDRFTTRANLGKLFPELRLQRALDAIGAKPVVQRSKKSAVYPREVVDRLQEFEKASPAHRRRKGGRSRSQRSTASTTSEG